MSKDSVKMQDYLRVTQVLSPFSGLSKAPPDILKQAGERGTKVHEICSAIMDDIGLGSVESKLIGYIDSFNKWREDKKFISRPDRFYCDKYNITGEVDGLYLEKDGLVLIDIKTSYKPNKVWPLQGSAYAYLCKEKGITIKRIEFIKLSKDGKPPKIFTYEYQFDKFLECLDMFKTYFKDMENTSEEDWLSIL